MIYSSSDIEYDTLKLVIMGHYPFTLPPKNPENQNFEKIKKKKKKKCWRYYNFTQVYQKP